MYAPMIAEPIHYYPASSHPLAHMAPFAAMVTYVHPSQAFVNLQIFLPVKCADNPPDGQKVPFIHSDEPRDANAEYCCRPDLKHPVLVSEEENDAITPGPDAVLPTPDVSFTGDVQQPANESSADEPASPIDDPVVPPAPPVEETTPEPEATTEPTTETTSAAVVQPPAQ